MYTKDKLHRITLRLNEEQFQFVKKSADLLDVSPSDFLRMVINATMVSMNAVDESDGFDGETFAHVMVEETELGQRALAAVEEKTGKERCGRENDKADIDDIL